MVVRFWKYYQCLEYFILFSCVYEKYFLGSYYCYNFFQNTYSKEPQWPADSILLGICYTQIGFLHEVAIWGKNYKSIQKTGLVYPSTGSQTPPACRGYESLGQKILEIQFFKVYHVSPHFKGILISNFKIKKSLENLEERNTDPRIHRKFDTFFQLSWTFLDCITRIEGQVQQ